MEPNGKDCHRERRASRREILEKKKAVEEIIKAASSLKDHLFYLPEFHHYQINGLFLHLESGHGNKLSIGTKRCIQNLLKLNMEEHFGPEWLNEEKIKRREMLAEEARYIFVHEISNGDEKEVSNLTDVEATCTCKGPIVGFVHYRFVVEEEIPVVYVYELQLEPHIQGKGLGKFLMQILEVIASKNRMSAVMLTVQRANLMAINFYVCKLGYTISAISPSRADPLLGPTKSYEILCKTFDREARIILEVQTQYLSRSNPGIYGLWPSQLSGLLAQNKHRMKGRPISKLICLYLKLIPASNTWSCSNKVLYILFFTNDLVVASDR